MGWAVFRGWLGLSSVCCTRLQRPHPLRLASSFSKGARAHSLCPFTSRLALGHEGEPQQGQRASLPCPSRPGPVRLACLSLPHLINGNRDHGSAPLGADRKGTESDCFHRGKSEHVTPGLGAEGIPALGWVKGSLWDRCSLTLASRGSNCESEPGPAHVSEKWEPAGGEVCWARENQSWPWKSPWFSRNSGSQSFFYPLFAGIQAP